MAPVGYLALLRDNRAFRRLWYGQIVSQLGDWFDSIALFALLLNLTGSGQAVGALLVAQFLPSTVVGLWAGVVVDRLPRKLVMIAANLGSAALVLLFLLVRDPGQVWIIYVVTVLKMSLVSFFDPARTAAATSSAPAP
jgi:MFS family permease